MRTESMSNNIIDIILSLAKNDGLLRLIVNNDDEPMKKPVKLSVKDLIYPRNCNAKILPLPFDVNATEDESSFIRVYYNDGELNENEVIADSQIHIDIICAKSLWLINDGDKSLIRPYEIMSRVMDMLGRRSVNTKIKLHFNSYQHLYINSKYDAIRLYCEYMSIET